MVSVFNGSCSWVGALGPAGRVRVKCRGDATVYSEFAPLRQDDVGTAGMPDPGSGSGPVEYKDIEFVEIRRDHWERDLSTRGKAAFLLLLGKVKEVDGLLRADDLVRWTRTLKERMNYESR
jgi:hypothetical protein